MSAIRDNPALVLGAIVLARVLCAWRGWF